MKKLISVIPITILICVLLSNVKVSAITANNVGYKIHYLADVGQYVGYIVIYNFQTWANSTDTNMFFRAQTLGYNPQSDSLSGCIFLCENAIAGIAPGEYDVTAYASVTGAYYVKNIPYRNGDFITPTPSPTPTPRPTPTPTPIPNIWDKFYEWYYNIYGYYPADDSLFGYFRSLFEEDQESSGSGGPSQHSISTHRPPPTPTPTPIPYSVIVQPNYDSSGNVINYTYNYSYTSESGDTIIVTSPPDNSGNNNSNNNETYNPDPLAVPSSALDAWYMFAYDENEHPNPELQNPNNDFGTGMKYIEDNIDEYDKPIDYIMAVVNSFPDEWLLLFGMGIGLIFIAGIISRFLS